jgi:hypothetical protein
MKNLAGELGGEALDRLLQFDLRALGDKIDLELCCVLCNEYLCDAQAGDTLYSLVAMTADHACKDQS